MQSFPTPAAAGRMVEPKMEAAGIEPARHSPRRYLLQSANESLFVRQCLNHADHPAVVELEADLFNARGWLADGQPTHVYIVEEPGAVKVGVARDPVRRVASIQVGNPRPVQLIAYLPATTALERFLHGSCDGKLIGEWFAKTPRVLAVCSLLVAVAEQLDDFVEEAGVPDPADALAALTARVECLHRACSGTETA